MQTLGNRILNIFHKENFENVSNYFNQEKCLAVDNLSIFEIKGICLHVQSLMNFDKLDVISLGCGDGKMEEILLKYATPKSLTCIDFSERNLSLAKKRLPNYEFIQMDLRNFSIQALPKTPKFYDLIYSISLAQYLTEDEIKNLHCKLFDVLKYGGEIFHFNVPDKRRKFLYRLNNAIIMENIKYLLPSQDFIDEFSNWCDRKFFRSKGYKTNFFTPSYHWERFDVVMKKI